MVQYLDLWKTVFAQKPDFLTKDIFRIHFPGGGNFSDAWNLPCSRLALYVKSTGF